jgi:hypothetical protein
MVTEAPAAVKAELGGQTPGQVSFSFERRPAVDVLKGVEHSGLTLDLALRVRNIVGKLPDDFKFYRLALWQPDSRSFLAKEILEDQQIAARNEQQLAAGALPAWEARSIREFVERVRAYPDPEALEEAPAEWGEFMRSLPLSERSMVGRLIHSVNPERGYHVIHAGLFTTTMADVRAENPEVLEEGDGLLRENEGVKQFLKKRGLFGSVFKAVAFGKDNPQS